MPYTDNDIFRVARFVLASHTTLPHTPSNDTVDAAARLLTAFDARLMRKRNGWLYRLARYRRRNYTDVIGIPQARTAPNLRIEAPFGRNVNNYKVGDYENRY